jgi:hypothetical protein
MTNSIRLLGYVLASVFGLMLIIAFVFEGKSIPAGFSTHFLVFALMAVGLYFIYDFVQVMVRFIRGEIDHRRG